MSSNATPGRSRRPLIAPIAVVCLVAGGIYAWQQLRPAPAASAQPSWRGGGTAPVPVRIAVAKREPMAVRIKALGTVTPLNTVTIRSRNDGELVKVGFTEGQRMKDSAVRCLTAANKKPRTRTPGVRLA